MSSFDYQTLNSWNQSKLIKLLDNNKIAYPHFVAKIDDLNNVPIRCFFASSLNPLNEPPIQLSDTRYWVGYTLPIDDNEEYIFQVIHLFVSHHNYNTGITYMRYMTPSGFGNWINTTPIKYTDLRYTGDISIPSSGYIQIGNYFSIPNNTIGCAVANFGSCSDCFNVCFQRSDQAYIFAKPETIIKNYLLLRFYTQ